MQNQSFPLANYFMYIPERFLDQGRTLLKSDAIGKIQTMRKGLQTFQFDTDPACEVELVTGRKKVRSFSCDCDVFQESGICGHIAAAIMHVIRERDKQLQQKRQSEQRLDTAKPRQLPVNRIIAGMNENQLRSFVQKYATQDQEFALHLKAQFGHKVDLKDNLGKYYDILKRYENHAVKSRLNKIKFRRLLNFLTDLLHHADDLLAEKNYREAYFILYGSLKFLISRYTKLRDFDIQATYLEVHDRLWVLLKQDLAPRFKSDIWVQCRQLYQENAYDLEDPVRNLFHILYQQADPEHKEEILNDLLCQISTRVELLPLEYQALFYLFYLHGRHADARQLLIDQREVPHLAESLLDMLSPEEDPQLIYNLVRELHHVATGRRLLSLAYQYLIPLEKDPKQRLQWHIDYYLQWHDQEVLDTIKNEASDWEATCQVLVEELRERRAWSELTRLLRGDHQLAALKKILEERGSLELLIENAHYLDQQDRPWLRGRLLYLMDQYLSTHVGYHSVDFVTRILRQLNRMQLQRLSRDVSAEIMERYAERSFFTRALKDAMV